MNLRHHPFFRYALAIVVLISVTAIAIRSQVQATTTVDDAAVYGPVVYRAEYTPTPTSTPTPTITPSPTNTPTPTITPTPSLTPTPMVEFRGLWVSRFDWTRYGVAADPAKIDEIVQQAADAGFNVIFFQIRGTADAFYQSDLEPWASRVSGGALGQPPDPWWDPLAHMIDAAHDRGIQVHAYLNIYPVWNCGSTPADDTTPQHLYHQLIAEHGQTDSDLPHALIWNEHGELYCASYQRITPASLFFDDHLVSVVQDIVDRYDVDGIHLDHIRYGGPTASCDPVSEERFKAPCFEPGYEDWQRRQVNGTVERIYNEVVVNEPDLWYSAAVWPIYQDYWGWGVRSGYDDYYQDSKAWINGGYMDSISPMIYPVNFETDTFWTQERWSTLVTNFMTDRGERVIVPGIGANYSDFAEISARIEKSRELGTAGHAVFSYTALNTNGYFDDLAAGPYAIPATVPAITWRQ